MKPNPEPAGILLAAGRSRRFGGDKLLHPVAGAPMVLASAHALRAVLPRTVAVIRKDSAALAELLAANGIETAIAEDADNGMGASLAAGVAAAAAASGWVVALGDMPFVRPQTVALVADALVRGAGLAAPRYRGRRGHPVGFARSYRDCLLGLDGDRGARRLLRQCAGELVMLDCDDAGVLRDIDRRESPWLRG